MLSKYDIITGEKLQQLFTSRGFKYSHSDDVQKIIPTLEKDSLLLTHNSDAGVNKKFKEILDSPLIAAWFAQNVELIHPKLHAVPIGLANSKWPHGNLNTFEKYLNNNNPRQNLCYFGYKVSTHPPIRQPLKDIIQKMHPSWPFLENISFDKYCKMLSNSKYCICPRGNGIDTHRLWECLYYKVIPLVDRNPVTEYFEYLGLVIVDDWTTITKEFLEKNYDMFYSKLKIITISYYEDIIDIMTRNALHIKKLCIIVSTSCVMDGANQIVRIKETWEKQANLANVKIVYSSDEEMLDLKRIYEKYNPEYIYCCTADTHVKIEKIIKLIDNFNSSENLYLGCNGRNKLIEKDSQKTFFFRGTRGFILSNNCVLRLYPALENIQTQWRYICIKNGLKNKYITSFDLCIGYYCKKNNSIAIKNDEYFSE